MNGTSSVSDLQSRLQKRAKQDRKEIEALAAISHRWDLKRPPCLV